MSSIVAYQTSSVSTAESSRILTRNLEALGSRHRELAQKLALASPAPTLAFAETPDGVPSVVLDDRPLCSRHRPIAEARRLVDGIDIVENAVVVVFGFGAGYHVQLLAQRMKRTGVVIVFEPDVSLLRGVLERNDISSWLEVSNIVWITDVADRAGLAAALDGAESILAQGVEFVEHPPSRQRLGDQPAQFSELLTNYIATAKTTLMTTLMRSVDTVRNLLHNIDHYVTAGGITELEGACRNQPAVIVSAGPSLARSLKLLAQPGVRDRCVIIAVQTTLQPLLDAGIKPHFVTALDYHEISRRFYEQLNPEDVADVTLIVEPKAHPVILDAYPGPIRICASRFLDDLLGECARDMGTIRPGATVAHLALYVAELLGCNPIALIGQDLGFTDGLYYAPGISIEDVWAPELGPFNTIEMMQWQRIARHRVHLHKTTDVHGRSIYSDAQMLTYLRQFERDFKDLANRGITVIDATEGGLAKQHTESQSLQAFLAEHTSGDATPPPLPTDSDDAKHRSAVQQRIASIRQEITALQHVSMRTQRLLQTMIADQDDAARMEKHFQRLEKFRSEVQQRIQSFELLNHVNQLGVFKRLKADRRLHLSADMSPLDRQRAELDRDLENVRWIADAADELLRQLLDAERILNGATVSARPAPISIDALDDDTHTNDGMPTCIAALIAVDPDRNGLLQPCSLMEDIHGCNVLQQTLQQLGTSRTLKMIVMLVPDTFDVEPLLDRSAIGVPVEIERCGASPYPPEHEAIAAARAWSASCWRGGITGVSIYDELLCPTLMRDVMAKRGITAALLVGSDWPLVQVLGEHGCDAIIQRHLDYPKQNSIVFTQAAPGLCGCVVSASEMDSLAQRNRVATIGARLTYQPGAPQTDPIAKDLNVQIPPALRNTLVRATADSPANVNTIKQLLQPDSRRRVTIPHADEIVQKFEAQRFKDAERSPEHLIVELTTRRTSCGQFARHPFGNIERADLEPATLAQFLDSFGESRPTAITFDGVGDPLLHPAFDECIRSAKRAKCTVHVRTELLCDHATVDRLLDSGVDVVSIDLHADRAATYQTMMGTDRFKEVLLTMQYLLDHRRVLTAQTGLSAIALPWIVPRLQRCAATYEDIDSFFDRWQHTLGTAVLEGCPTFNTAGESADDTLLPAVTPRAVVKRELQRRMTVFCDGSVPIDECDLPGRSTAGNIHDTGATELWKQLFQSRRTKLDSLNLWRP